MLQSILKFDALKDRWRFSVWVITLVSVFIELVSNAQQNAMFFFLVMHVNCNTQTICSLHCVHFHSADEGPRTEMSCTVVAYFYAKKDL